MHGFPPALTSFVGRAVDVVEVVSLLGEHRLVTVTGPGGVGKTRLAAEVAKAAAGQFADGAWLVELAAVQEPTLVQAAVATALGIRQPAGTSLMESLLAVLARQQLLLVLDNCEHVLAAAAELCGTLLMAADDVRVLATSREQAGVAGEARYRLGPLALPRPGESAGTGGSEAVVLFAERARLASPHFALDAGSWPTVARLVARLDGMPLAIELAAARVEALGLPQLLERLDDRFAVLAGGDRLAPNRLRSLVATVEWSYRLLSDAEQRVFRQLAIYPGPFTLEAAEAVAGSAADNEVLHLVDCSLLVPPQPGPDGRTRYVMLETLRAYGADRLADAGEHDQAAAKLAAYALYVAERAAFGTIVGPAELAASQWLDAEDAATRQSLSWALEYDPQTALRLAVALAPWWVVRGRHMAGYELLDAAVQRVPGPDDLLCTAQYWLGVLASYSEMATALSHYTAAVAAAAADQNWSTLANALANRSRALTSLSRVAEARTDAGKALDLAREHGYPGGEARGLLGLFFAAEAEEEADEALAWAQQAASINPAVIPGKLARMSSEILTRGLMDDGEVDQARGTCADGLFLARQAGDLPGQADFLSLGADLALRAGDVPAAAALIREAIEVSSKTGYRSILANCLDICGGICAETHRWDDAVTAWAAYGVWLHHVGATEGPTDALRKRQTLKRADQALGPDRMRAAEQRGAAMGMTAAAEFALLLAAESSTAPPKSPDLCQLSPREQELVTLVAGGSTNAQIAAQLYISVRTVGSHMDRIRDKTGCRRRADLTRLALQTGLV